VDAKNAPTRTWKTAQNAVSHSAHTRHPIHEKREKIKDRTRRRQPPLHTKFLTLPPEAHANIEDLAALLTME
jgi:hypothetical protein